MIDLHTHSACSDGQLSPTDLISFAASQGVSVLALTDHDTVSGLPDAEKKAQELHMTFVPGVELNIEWPTGEFHLLGLGLKHISSSLQDVLSHLQLERQKRNQVMVSKMQEAGMDVSLEELLSIYKTECLGRPHFADFMVKKGIVKKQQQAFDLYLAKSRPIYVPRVGASLDEAIVSIKDSGGVPVLAHPLSLYLSWGKIEPVLQELYERGIEGIEAWHPGVRVVEAERLETIGRRIGFFITGGSDFHGENVRMDRKIGRTSGMTKIDEKLWTENLLPALQK